MRLFDADVLRAVLIPLEQKYAGAYADLGAAVGCIVQQIDRFPAADAAIVTRCKDCKYYRSHPNGLCYLRTEPKKNERGYSGEAVCVEPDDFCSYGERRDDDVSD